MQNSDVSEIPTLLPQINSLLFLPCSCGDKQIIF